MSSVGPTRIRPKRAGAALVLLAAAMVVTAVVSAGIGAMWIAPVKVVAILLSKLGAVLAEFRDVEASVIWAVRLPRVVLGLVVGAGLALAGASLQGLFRNPLADPGLIGVSSGGALGAALLIVLAPDAGAMLGVEARLLMLPMVACAGGAACVLLVYRLALRHGAASVADMLLSGIAVNALCGAGIGLLTYISDEAALRSLTVWSLGSLGGATWSAVAVVAPCVLVATLAVVRDGRALNALLLGEDEATYLGVDVGRLKRRVVAASALAVGAGVGFVGLIGFVGLVVPHVVRMWVGPDHRRLLPASALAGAILVMVADDVCRTAVAPAELPIGVVMALVGAPFFLILMARRSARAMG